MRGVYLVLSHQKMANKFYVKTAFFPEKRFERNAFVRPPKEAQKKYQYQKSFLYII